MNKFCFAAFVDDKTVFGHMKAPSGSDAKAIIIKTLRELYKTENISVQLLGITSEPFRVTEL